MVSFILMALIVKQSRNYGQGAIREELGDEQHEKVRYS